MKNGSRRSSLAATKCLASAARRFAVDVTQGQTIPKQVCELFSLFWVVRTQLEGGGSAEGPVGEGCCAESRRSDQKFDQLQSVHSHFSFMRLDVGYF